MSDYFRHELNPYNNGGDESARTNYFIFQAGMITINNELSPVIQTLQEQNKAQAEEIERLRADREKLVVALIKIKSGKGWPPYALNDHAEEALKSIGEIE